MDGGGTPRFLVNNSRKKQPIAKKTISTLVWNTFTPFLNIFVTITPMAYDLFFSRPFQARMAIQDYQRQFCVGTVAVWSLITLKRHDVISQTNGGDPGVVWISDLYAVHFRSFKVICGFAYNFL